MIHHSSPTSTRTSPVTTSVNSSGRICPRSLVSVATCSVATGSSTQLARSSASAVWGPAATSCWRWRGATTHRCSSRSNRHRHPFSSRSSGEPPSPTTASASSTDSGSCRPLATSSSDGARRGSTTSTSASFGTGRGQRTLTRCPTSNSPTTPGSAAQRWPVPIADRAMPTLFPPTSGITTRSPQQLRTSP